MTALTDLTHKDLFSQSTRESNLQGNLRKNALNASNASTPGENSVRLNEKVSALMSDFFSRRSEKTRVAYVGDLTAFAASTGQPSSLAAVRFLLSLPAGEANGAVLRYRSEMIAAGLSPATVNRRLAAVRSVVKLARTLGLVSWSIEISGESARAYRDTSGPGRSGILRILSFLQARAAEAPDKTVQEQQNKCFSEKPERRFGEQPEELFSGGNKNSARKLFTGGIAGNRKPARRLFTSRTGGNRKTGERTGFP